MSSKILEPLRLSIGAAIAGVTSGGGGPKINYSQPLGDPGLFGPNSVCWRVHSDPTSMFVGGFAALLLQALEPRALAGVFDHSNFRADPYGRLRRTSTFVMGTTYAPRVDALALIARVRQMHGKVSGNAPDGRTYSAGDGALLTWVHVCEMYCFLRAYRRYVAPKMLAADQDRYYDEVALIAEALGAKKVPRTREAVAHYLRAMQPQLAGGEGVQSIVEFLRDTAPPSAAAWPFARLLFQASAELLPAWARQLAGLQKHAFLRSALARPAMQGVAPLMRWGLRGASAPYRAQQRMLVVGNPPVKSPG